MTNTQANTTKPVTNKAITIEGEQVTAANSQKSGFDALNKALHGEVKARGLVATASKALAAYLLKAHGPDVLMGNTDAGKSFAGAWDSNYKGDENQKSVNKGRVLRFVALAAKSSGVSMTEAQAKRGEKLIATYDSNKGRKGAKPAEARDYQTRIGDEVTALYKFHMKTEDFGGMSATKVDSVGMAFETVLRLVGIDPAKVRAEQEAASK